MSTRWLSLFIVLGTWATVFRRFPWHSSLAFISEGNILFLYLFFIILSPSSSSSSYFFSFLNSPILWSSFSTFLNSSFLHSSSSSFLNSSYLWSSSSSSISSLLVFRLCPHPLRLPLPPFLSPSSFAICLPFSLSFASIISFSFWIH